LSEYRATVTSAKSAIDSVIGEIVAVKEKLQGINSDVPVQEAKIVAASANIDKYQAQRNDYTIIAPFDGVVVDVPAISGEIVSANQNVVSLISNSSVGVEVFIPEVHVKDLNVGDPAKVRFDAFGDELILGATVVYVEERGVVRDGIVTYKTKLEFSVAPESVRSGMTASIEIDASNCFGCFDDSQDLQQRFLMKLWKM
jgi:multidrug resistance efflux pump